MAENRARVRSIGTTLFFTDIALILGQGRSVLIRAKGWSMLPLLWSERDKLTISPLQTDSIQVGRVVLAHLETKRYVVHRIVRIEGDKITLRGDGNPYQIEECTHSQILGEMTCVIRDGKRIHRGDPLWQRIQDYWPSSPIIRRVFLAIYRRLFGIHQRIQASKR